MNSFRTKHTNQVHASVHGYTIASFKNKSVKPTDHEWLKKNLDTAIKRQNINKF